MLELAIKKVTNTIFTKPSNHDRFRLRRPACIKEAEIDVASVVLNFSWNEFGSPAENNIYRLSNIPGTDLLL